jgi:hypothetical protein
MAGPYKSGPRKINLVSTLFFVGFVLGAYSLVRFGPPYWTQWRIKEVLREACAKLYQARKGNPTFRANARDRVERDIRKAMTEMDIDDPEATVEIEDDDPDWIVARATYTITINHPIGSPTQLHFTPEVRTDTKPIDWGKK